MARTVTQALSVVRRNELGDTVVSSMSDLDRDTMTVIAGHICSAVNLLRLGSTCQTWQSVVSDDALWRSLTLRQFPMLRSVLAYLEPHQHGSNLKFSSIYQQNCTVDVLRWHPHDWRDIADFTQLFMTFELAWKGTTVASWTGPISLALHWGAWIGPVDTDDVILPMARVAVGSGAGASILGQGPSLWDQVHDPSFPEWWVTKHADFSRRRATQDATRSWQEEHAAMELNCLSLDVCVTDSKLRTAVLHRGVHCDYGDDGEAIFDFEAPGFLARQHEVILYVYPDGTVSCVFTMNPYRPDEEPFFAGECATIHGLVSKPHLNGRKCVVVGRLGRKHHHVRLEDGTEMALKPANLEECMGRTPAHEVPSPESAKDWARYLVAQISD